MSIETISAFAPALFGSGVLTLVFAYLWSRHQEPALALWTTAWALWTLRRVFPLITDSLQVENPPFALLVLVASYVTLMLFATALFVERPIAKIWVPIIVGALLWAGTVPAPRLDHPSSVAFLAAISIGWGWAGALFLSGRGLGPERWIPGIAMILMAGTNLLVLAFGDSPRHAAWGGAVVFGLQGMIAIGILAVFLRRTRMQLSETHGEIESALTRALAEFLPVCANCKKVREEAEWTPLELYIEGRTTVSVATATCPDCLASGRSP